MRRFTYKNIFHVLFALFLLALPFSKGIHSVAYVGLLVLSVGGLFFRKHKGFVSGDLQKIVLPVFILWIALAISLLYTQNLSAGLDELRSHSKMIGVPLFIALNIDLVRKRYDGYIFIFIRAVAIASGITLLFFVLPDSLIQTITESTRYFKEYIPHEKKYAFGAYSPFIDRLQFSYLIAIAFFLECWSTYHLSPPKRFPYLPLNFHIVILLLTLLILGARGAQLGFILGVGIWGIGIYLKYGHPIIAERNSSILSYLVLIVGLGFLTILLPYIAFKTIPTIQERYNQLTWEIGTYQDGTIQNYDYTHFTSIRRLVSWQHSWEVIQEQPILGVGIGDYALEMEQKYAADKLGFPVNTQSQFLYYWVSAGLLAVFAFLGIWGAWLWQGIRQQQYWKRVLFISLFAFYLLVLVLDAPLNFQVGAMTFWLVYALLLVRQDSFFGEI